MRKRLFKTFIVLTIMVALFFLINTKTYTLAKAASYKALKVFEYYKIREFSSAQESVYKDHFIINNRGADKDIVESIGNLLEKSYSLIGEEFQYYPDKVIPVFVYGSMEDFWEYNKALQGQAIMGLYNLGVIHIISPDAFGLTIEEYELNGPILHEYTHLMVDELTGGNIELWFTEGMALYQEYNIYQYEWGEFMEEVDYTLNDLRDDFMTLEYDKAYRKAFLIVKNLYENVNKEKVLDFLKELKSGEDFYDTFMAIANLQN